MLTSSPLLFALPLHDALPICSVALDNPDAPDSFTIDFSGMNRLIGGGDSDRLNSSTDNGAWVMTEPHKGALTVSLADDEFRSEERTSELQSRGHIVCRRLLEK